MTNNVFFAKVFSLEFAEGNCVEVRCSASDSNVRPWRSALFTGSHV